MLGNDVKKKINPVRILVRDKDSVFVNFRLAPRQIAGYFYWHKGNSILCHLDCVR
jgi:hypothetical protein